MRLYLLRHGQASATRTEAGRPLTETGRREVQAVAAYLRRNKISIPDIWHSPKLRARQTAEIAARGMGSRPRLTEKAGLKPGGNAAAVAREIAGLNRDLMLVSHLPFTVRLAALLLAGKRSLPVIEFQTGGLACLERTEAGGWSLLWLLSPTMLSGLAGPSKRRITPMKK